MVTIGSTNDGDDDWNDGSGGGDVLLCHSDAQNRVFGTKAALVWCNAKKVQELLQELAFFRQLPSDTQKLPVSIGIAARGESFMHVISRNDAEMASTINTAAINSPSLLQFQVLLHVSYKHVSQVRT